MKKAGLLLAAISTLIVGCQQDFTTDSNIGGGSALTVSLAQTRTSLGKKCGDTYPVYWSIGDKISVNGVASAEVEIDNEERSRARFSVPSELRHPLYITYPHCESTTANSHIVEFSAEQTYTEGSFANGSAPMCGYSEHAGEDITLAHLAAVLRLPIRATLEGVVLEKVVITSLSGAKLAGQFTVDCQSATIAATESCGSEITFTLPDNFTLSTTQDSPLYIALPAVNVGRCKIEFFDTSGRTMVASWTPNKPLSKGIVREFKSICYIPGATATLQAMESVNDEFTIFYKNVHGNVRYSDGAPIAGVSVSDGFQVTTTDSNGYYELKGITKDTWFIYCSLPADVKVPINEYGQPCFWKRFPAESAQFDFTFERLEGGKEQEFVIVGMADPQPGSTTNVERFAAQVAPEIKSYTKSLGVPCYGVALGDIISMSETVNKEYLFYDMRDEMAINKIGMPVFGVMGNHDNAYVSPSHPVFPDEYSSTFNFKIQRVYEDCFGPVDYSFNRGDVHIICMRDMQYTTNTTASSYSTGFTEKQFEWIKQDLANVPKDKMVILCVHIPLFNKSNNHIQEVLSMMDAYAEAHIFSGHYHANEPYDHVALKTGHKVFEHSLTSINGASWKCNLAADGTPNGYTIFHANGNTFVNWYHKSYAYGMNDRNHQMRLYRGGTITGAEKEGSDSNGTKGYYQFPYDSNVVLANVFSSDPWNWSVEVYEDGVRGGNMTSLYAYRKYIAYDKLVGDGTFENPKRPDSSVKELAHDFWATGVLLGKIGAKPPLHYEKSCWTMWKYTLKNPDTRHIEVRATDKFGNVYTEDKFQDGTDMTYALYDPQYNPVIE